MCMLISLSIKKENTNLGIDVYPNMNVEKDAI